MIGDVKSKESVPGNATASEDMYYEKTSKFKIKELSKSKRAFCVASHSCVSAALEV